MFCIKTLTVAMYDHIESVDIVLLEAVIVVLDVVST